MDRLIKIDDVMSVFDDFTRGDLDTEDVIVLRDMLEEKAIPSAEPQIVPIAEIKFNDDMLHEIVEEVVKNIEIEPKWIPVSDKIPQMEEWVLCQCRAGIYEVLKYTSYGWYHDDAHCYMAGFVIAWMPLPKLYEPQKISYTVEQDLNEYKGNIEIIEKKY